MFKKAQPRVKVGLSENSQFFCFAYQKEGKLTIRWLDKKHENVTEFEQQAVRFEKKFTFVRAVTDSFIWRKYFFMPSHLSEDALYKHILHTLSKELPLSLSEVYFDYQIKFIDKQTKLIRVFVLRKDYSESLMLNKDTILDSELHCFIRGFQSLYADEINFDKPFFVQGRYFLLADNQFKVLAGNFEDCYSVELLNLPNDLPDKQLYVIALGASLWNGKV